MGEEDKSIAVTLPHDAMLSEPRTAQSAGGTNTGWFEGYDYVYQKAFNVPAEWADRAVFLEFEGVYRDAEVFVNDARPPFSPEATPAFSWLWTACFGTDSENHIRVISRNADPSQLPLVLRRGVSTARCGSTFCPKSTSRLTA